MCLPFELNRPPHIRSFAAAILLIALLTFPARTPAQGTGSLRVYVLRTNDDASDRAVVQALTERGHQVSLGVRARQLDSAAVRLAEYHAVVALGVEREPIPTTVVNTLARYLEGRGGLLTDGEMVWELGRDGANTLRLPATHCNTVRSGSATTIYERVDPPDPIVHNGLPPSFGIDLTTLSGGSTPYVEICLSPAFGGRRLFTSRGPGETTARAGVVSNQPTPTSRAISFSVSIRNRELQNPNFRRAFVNSVEWIGAASGPLPLPQPEASPTARRVYVLRTGDQEADTSVVQALTERGHEVSLGVRARQLESAAVRLSDYHVIVALGVEREPIPSTVVNILSRYLSGAGGGGLVTDGEMVWELGRDGANTLRLPATHCNTVRNGNATTTYERVDPADPIVHDGIPPSFNLALTTLSGGSAPYTELCLSPVAAGKLLQYSRNPEDSYPRPGVVANEPDIKTRMIAFSAFIRKRELDNPNFRRLFVNSVEWAGALAQPTPHSEIPDESTPLRVYVLRSGDELADTEVQKALQDRGHEASLGVRASQLPSAPELSQFDAVVAMGAEREPISQAGMNVLSRYLQGSGRLVLDGEMVWELGSTAGPLRLPAQHCNTVRNGNPRTTFERIDPPDSLFHTRLPPSFQIDLTTLSGGSTPYIELCLTPAAGARLMFYSRSEGELVPRPGALVNEPGPDSRAAQFSVSLRRRELLNPNFRRLFVNAVEWVAGKIPPPPSLQASPEELSFIFNSSASAPRPQTLLVTANTLNAIPLTAVAATSSGGDWLTVEPDRATTPANLSVRVVPTFLPPGVYNGQITLTGGATTLTVPVRVTINSTATCDFRISPASASFSATGGAGTIGVVAPPGCTWTAASGVPWVSITSGSSGSGSGTVQFTVSPATGTQARSGTLTVAGQPFAISQAGTSLSFRLDTNALDFRAVEGAAQAESRVVSILSTASAPFSATAMGGAWLSVTPQAGTAPGSISAAVNPAGLAPGTYRGAVLVRIPNATPPEQSVTVVLTVEAAGAPQLRIEPGTLRLSAIEGGQPITEQLLLSNGGRGALTFRATAGGGAWLSVQSDTESVSSASPASLLVTGDPRGLAAGSYSGSVVLTSSAGQETAVSVLMTVSNTRHSILLSQTGLTFTAVAQGGNVPPQTFGVLNLGSGVMDWEASSSTLSGGAWLSVSRGRGSADAASLNVPLVDVGITPANLRPGEYHGRIIVTSPTASNSPQIVSVILQVLPPGSDPGPIVRPTGLIFAASAGSSGVTSQDVQVANLTSAQRTFVSSRLTTDGRLWFTPLPAQATVSPAQPTRISVQSDPSGLTPGVRRGVLTLLFADGAVQNVSLLSVVAPATSTPTGVRAAAGCASPRLVLTFTSLRQGFVAALGQGTTIEAKAVDECGNPLIADARRTGTVVSASFSNGDPPVHLVHMGGGVWSGTWRPVRAATGAVTMTVTGVFISGNTRQAGQATIAGTIRGGGQTPIVTAGGLVHSASFASGVPIAPGTLISIIGSNLSEESATSGDLPLPRELNGTEVLLGNRSLPLLYVSRDQVNVQAPFDLPPNTQHQLMVRRGQELSVPESITVTEAMPGIFAKNSAGTGQGSILRKEANVLAEPGTPAAAGEVITVYCTGLGAVTDLVEPGAPSPVENPARVPAAVQLTIGGRNAEILFAGLTPNTVGLYQVDAIVPEGITPGDAVEVTITAAGHTSPAVTMAVR
jgi:uncharacterized protein (TIGR03437 family)